MYLCRDHANLPEPKVLGGMGITDWCALRLVSSTMFWWQQVKRVVLRKSGVVFWQFFCHPGEFLFWRKNWINSVCFCIISIKISCFFGQNYFSTTQIWKKERKRKEKNFLGLGTCTGGRGGMESLSCKPEFTMGAPLLTMTNSRLIIIVMLLV